MGRGRGRGQGYATEPCNTAGEARSEVEMLKDQLKYLGESLASINKRITEIDKEKK
jgi:prefoldin subunit 5